LEGYDFKGIINKMKEEVKGGKEKQNGEPGEGRFCSLDAKKGSVSLLLMPTLPTPRISPPGALKGGNTQDLGRLSL
jgi:hypothetical protein